MMNRWMKVILINSDNDIMHAADVLLGRKKVFVKLIEKRCLEKTLCFLSGITYVIGGDIKLYEPSKIFLFTLRENDNENETAAERCDKTDEWEMYIEDDCSDEFEQEREVEFSSCKYQDYKETISRIEEKIMDIVKDHFHLDVMIYGHPEGYAEQLQRYLHEDFESMYREMSEWIIDEIYNIISIMKDGQNVTVTFDTFKNRASRILFYSMAGGCYALNGKIERINDMKFRFEINDTMCKEPEVAQV